MIDAVVIRRIRVGEAGLLRQVRLAALLESPYAFSSTYDEALRRSEESWQTQADQTAQGGDRATFVAFLEEAPIGIAALYRIQDQNDTGELVQMWVAPEHRGKQVSWNLLQAVFEWAGKNSFRTVIARVTAENARALRFYHNYGFILEEEMLLDEFDGVVLVRPVGS